MTIDIQAVLDRSTGNQEVALRCQKWNNQKVDFDRLWSSQVVVPDSEKAIEELVQLIRQWTAKYPAAKE